MPKKSDSKLVALAFLLAIVFIASLAFYRYASTIPGRVFLVDVGVSKEFDGVRRDFEHRIIIILRSHGVASRTIEISEDDESLPPQAHLLRAETAPDASLVQINLALHRAAREMGGRVHSCWEGKDGRIITVDLGTRRFITHRCIIKKASERRQYSETKIESSPVVSVCVDDFGFFRNKLVKELLEIDIPITVSIIPNLEYSQSIALMAASAGKDVICHLPMEPEAGRGDGGEIPLVRVDMAGQDIEKAAIEALETVPGAIGMSNHMGSRATADRAVMKAVLGVCKDKGLFFFDSMTTPRSVVKEVARIMAVPCASNDIFLDNEGDVRENMQKLLSIAARRGEAIGIVHVKPGTPGDLRWMSDRAQEEGIKMISLRELIARRTALSAQGGLQ